jgi:predicted glycoside hydrolase/deacetylase ChbG (UPF0249 family)
VNNSTRYVIVNADDFGNSEGVNRGIIEAHENGILTSASLMVNTPATKAAVKLAAEHPELGIGLHVNFTGENEQIVDLEDLPSVRRELELQFNFFTDLMGRLPTHVDSHQHVHAGYNIGWFFRDLCDRHRLPLRGYCEVVYCSGFYGQWEYGKTEEKYISPEFLISMLTGANPGFTEIACHPGYITAGFDPLYNREREIEIRSLTDPRVKAAIEKEGIRLINYGSIESGYGRLCDEKQP